MLVFVVSIVWSTCMIFGSSLENHSNQIQIELSLYTHRSSIATWPVWLRFSI